MAFSVNSGNPTTLPVADVFIETGNSTGYPKLTTMPSCEVPVVLRLSSCTPRQIVICEVLSVLHAPGGDVPAQA